MSLVLLFKESKLGHSVVNPSYDKQCWISTLPSPKDRFLSTGLCPFLGSSSLSDPFFIQQPQLLTCPFGGELEHKCHKRILHKIKFIIQNFDNHNSTISSVLQVLMIQKLLLNWKLCSVKAKLKPFWIKQSIPLV